MLLWYVLMLWGHVIDSLSRSSQLCHVIILYFNGILWCYFKAMLFSSWSSIRV